MKLYSVFSAPNDPQFKQAVFVPQGFSWGAFLGGFLWAFWHRLRLVGFFFMLIILTAFQWSLQLGFISIEVLSLVMAIFSAEIRSKALNLRGLNMVATVPASSQAEAEIRFFTSYKAEVAPLTLPNPVTPPHTQPDALGLFSQSA